VAESIAWLVLGSNIEPELHLALAVDLLSRRSSLLAASSVWQSPPADGSDQPEFLNAAVMLKTALPPEEFLSRVIAPIEKELGRERSGDKFSPRTIDIDLALYGERVEQSAGKILPHPDILRRAYFALPLAEISPEKNHPVTGESLQAIAARLQDGTVRRREDLVLRPMNQAVD
jgi:2-amino-4-hydroxy-6-hydroxymethyldihydropteridine diphosphokinase